MVLEDRDDKPSPFVAEAQNCIIKYYAGNRLSEKRRAITLACPDSLQNNSRTFSDKSTLSDLWGLACDSAIIDIISVIFSLAGIGFD